MLTLVGPLIESGVTNDELTLSVVCGLTPQGLLAVTPIPPPALQPKVTVIVVSPWPDVMLAPNGTVHA